MLNLFDNPIHPVNNATKKIFFLNIKKKKKKKKEITNLSTMHSKSRMLNI